MSTCPICESTVTAEVYDLAKFELSRVSVIPAGVRTDWEQMFMHALSLLIVEYESEHTRKGPMRAAPAPTIGEPPAIPEESSVMLANEPVK